MGVRFLISGTRFYVFHQTVLSWILRLFCLQSLLRFEVCFASVKNPLWSFIQLFDFAFSEIIRIAAPIILCNALEPFALKESFVFYLPPSSNHPLISSFSSGGPMFNRWE